MEKLKKSNKIGITILVLLFIKLFCYISLKKVFLYVIYVISIINILSFILFIIFLINKNKELKHNNKKDIFNIIFLIIYLGIPIIKIILLKNYTDNIMLNNPGDLDGFIYMFIEAFEYFSIFIIGIKELISYLIFYIFECIYFIKYKNNNIKENNEYLKIKNNLIFLTILLVLISIYIVYIFFSN